jgi:hypothetical protein
MTPFDSKRQTANDKGHRTLFAVCCLLFAVVLAACAEDNSGDSVDIVSEIPWDAPEAARYVIVNSDDEQQGEGVLSIVEDADGHLVFMQQFADEDGNADRSVVVADAQTLRPLRAERQITDASDDRRAVAVSRYGEEEDGDPIVRIAELNYDPADEDDPALRCSPLKINSPHFYDNDTSLFLWRTIRFEEGWSGTYTTVLSNRRVQGALTLTVQLQEQVTTPAGEFDAWLVRIEGEGRQSQRAWFATTPDHTLLVYNNNEDQVFLYAGEADPVEVDEVEELPEECEGEG